MNEFLKGVNDTLILLSAEDSHLLGDYTEHKKELQEYFSLMVVIWNAAGYVS